MRFIIVNRADDAVLSRLESPPGHAPREVFWQDKPTARDTNYRFAVRYPSADAAVRGAGVYGGEARELPDEVMP